MSTDLQALVRSPHFRWLRGMLTQHEERVFRILDDGRLLVVSNGGEEDAVDAVRGDCAGIRVPDPDDACTRGGLLQLVQEAWGADAVVAAPAGAGVAGYAGAEWYCKVWRLGFRGGPTTTEIVGRGHTGVDALAAALLAAPVRQ